MMIGRSVGHKGAGQVIQGVELVSQSVSQSVMHVGFGFGLAGVPRRAGYSINACRRILFSKFADRQVGRG